MTAARALTPCHLDWRSSAPFLLARDAEEAIERDKELIKLIEEVLSDL